MNIDITNNILPISATAEDVRLGLAARAKARRLEMNLTQKGMSARSGIPLATYRRFETSGEISLSNLVSVAVVLGMTADFDALFSQRRYQSMSEVMSAERTRSRRRGRKND